MSDDNLIRQSEAARLVGLTRSAIHLAVRLGQLKVYERYGIPLVSRKAVLKLWANGPRAAGRPRGS